MRLLNFTVIKLSIFLAIGIWAGAYFRVSWQISLFAFLGSLVFLGLAYLTVRKALQKNFLYDLTVCLSTFLLGVCVFNFHQEQHLPDHYTKIESFKNENVMLDLQVRERLKSNGFQHRYVAKLLLLDQKKASGTFLISIPIDSVSFSLKVDEIIHLRTDIKEINPPLNPHQFDYKKYLAQQQVFHQLQVTSNEIFTKSEEITSIYGWAANFREKINTALLANGFEEETLGIINALLLGQRQDISQDIYNNYIDAGAVHILAVSGLHIGILLMILNTFFSPLLYIKHGRLIRTALIVSILWIFAVIAGLSPSVVRAVTMFTVIAIAINTKRLTNTTNVLFISMFFLLLFKPNFLFSVGFQLSYSAVLSIVWFQPKFYRLLRLPKWIDWAWKLLSVSFAAQLGVLPISLFYFHQFPGLFFVSNLLIIPALGIILTAGIVIIALALLDMLPKFMVIAYQGVIEAMNYCVYCIAGQEPLVFRNIPFSGWMMISSYALILSLLWYWNKKSYKALVCSLASILIIQTVFILEKQEVAQGNEFVIFHKNRQRLLVERKGGNLAVWHDMENLDSYQDRNLKSYQLQTRTKIVSEENAKNTFQYREHKLLVLDSMGIYQLPKFQPDHILLQQSPRINLERMLALTNPKVVIADGSNYKSYIRRWKRTCAQKKIPFHYTGEKGAYIISK